MGLLLENRVLQYHVFVFPETADFLPKEFHVGLIERECSSHVVDWPARLIDRQDVGFAFERINSNNVRGRRKRYQTINIFSINLHFKTTLAANLGVAFPS